MLLEVLKYVLVVIAIIVVGGFIIWALGNLMLSILDPHGKDKKDKTDNGQNAQITYEQQKLLTNEPTYTSYVSEPVEVKPAEEARPQEEVNAMSDYDEAKAKEEEAALNLGVTTSELEDEEEKFIREKQRMIEERLAAKAAEEVQPEPVEEDEIDLDDIFVDEDEEVDEEPIVDQEDEGEDIEDLINKILDSEDEELTEEQETEVNDEVEDEVVDDSALQDKIRELEEELARQKEEYENKLKATEEESDVKVAELQQQLEEKEKQLQESEENKVQSGATLSLEEYEERLEILKERLNNNTKELKVIKKEYLPLAKIKKSYEKDKKKLRRKEALVAKQKVVLYGVNNYVDIDEEKAKKLSEDLDLLDGLRLSVQHCEEVLKANEERYPILESTYNVLLQTNDNIKADIDDVTAKIEELKAKEAETIEETVGAETTEETVETNNSETDAE